MDDEPIPYDDEPRAKFKGGGPYDGMSIGLDALQKMPRAPIVMKDREGTPHHFFLFLPGWVIDTAAKTGVIPDIPPKAQYPAYELVETLTGFELQHRTAEDMSRIVGGPGDHLSDD